MVGHTAEHLLFSGLKRAVPDIEIVKIFISPENKYVVVDRDVSWADIKKAQDFVNAAIKDNLSVVKSTM
jgi:alanyl-tRNA synthetase